VLALKDGACTAADLLGIGDVVRRPERLPGVSLFKSCGMGWQDLVVAEAALARWSAARGWSAACGVAVIMAPPFRLTILGKL